MNKRILKNLIKVFLKTRKGDKKGKRKIHGIAVIVVAAITVSGAVWAMGSESRELKKAEKVALQKQLTFEQDKNLATVDEEEVSKRAIQNAEKAKELIELKGEFATLTVNTERTAELSTDCDSKLEKIWSNNVLRINVPYVIKYMVALDKITSFVDENGVLCLIINPDDFKVVVSAGEYVKLTPDDEETGWFPKKFSDREILALINSNSNSVAEEYSTDEEKIASAVENAKEVVNSIVDTLGVKVKFIESTPINNLMFNTEVDNVSE